jgi:hypothetical protein
MIIWVCGEIKSGQYDGRSKTIEEEIEENLTY